MTAMAMAMSTITKPSANKRVKATGGRKPRVKGTADVKMKLNDIWANFLDELDDKMIT